MKRRVFISNMATQALSLSAARSLWAVGENGKGENYTVSPVNRTAVSEIAGHSLEELRDFHKRELFEEYIKLWDWRGIDWKYGGFLPYYDADGNYTTTDKEMYYLGRGLWTFSYIYNHFEKHERHLKAARLAKDFLFKYGRNKRGYWNSLLSQKGKILQGSFNIYGDIYMALGLGEFYKATGDEEARDVAVETVYGVMERIVSPGYQHLYGHGSSHEPGTKRLGTWQHFLSALTPLLKYTEDEGVERIARMCVRNILEYHWDRRRKVMYEYLNHDFKPFPEESLRHVSVWHAIQAAWMCMDEALRRGDVEMFRDALEMGRQMVERAWEYGQKTSGDLDDTLVFTALALEHTHESWAIYWFGKSIDSMYEKPDHWKRTCLLHHPRRLFFCIEILDRMIERKGMVSDFLDKA